MKILGIDYGDKRVGTALSDSLGITAQGYKTLENTGGKKLFLGLKEIIDENDVKTIVIGLPKNMDASEGFRVDATKEFAERLKKYTEAEIVFWDERLTSVAAHSFLSDLDIRGKKRKELVDTVSAALILEGYLNSKKI